MPKVEHPILLDVPDHFETERLLVRVPRPGDGPMFYQAIQDSLESLKPWMRWAYEPQTLSETEMRLRKDISRFVLREAFRMLIFRKEDGAFTGEVSLHSIVWSVPLLEIGYWGNAALSGQGYMTEAVRGLTDYAFTHLQAERMVIQCDTRNERSAAIARRLGYTLEATLRNDMREPDGTLSSGYLFGLLREEWLAWT